MAQPNERRLIKVVTLSNFLDERGNGIAIETLAIHWDYLVCGFSDGAVRFYDFHFKIKAWFEHLWNFGDKDKFSKEEEERHSQLMPVMSISFANTPPEKCKDNYDEGYEKIGVKNTEPPFACSWFFVSNMQAMVIQARAGLFDEIVEQNKCGEIVIESIVLEIKCIAVHP